MAAVEITVQPTAMKKHSVVFVGTGPEGEQTSFYVTNATLRKLGLNLSEVEQPGDLPALRLRFEIAS